MILTVVAAVTLTAAIHLAGDPEAETPGRVTERHVRNRLIELHNAGCDVKVVTVNAEGEQFMQAAVPGLGLLSTAKVKAHKGTRNEFVVIDAKYAGEWRNLVVTGSLNLRYKSLQNANDVMLRIIHKGQQ